MSILTRSGIRPARISARVQVPAGSSPSLESRVTDLPNPSPKLLVSADSPELTPTAPAQISTSSGTLRLSSSSATGSGSTAITFAPRRSAQRVTGPIQPPISTNRSPGPRFESIHSRVDDSHPSASYSRQNLSYNSDGDAPYTQ